MLRTFHPCAFQFKTTNIRRTGNVTDGGTSLSGLRDEIESTGGGYLTADFSGGSTRNRRGGNAWRALSDLDAGEAVIVLLCAERLFQPVNGLVKVPHSDAAPFDDGSLYASSGADYACPDGAALRATSLFLTGDSEQPLIGGELMSFLHPNWGWRAYRLRSVVAGDGGFHVTFRTPLRETITSGTPAEFDTPRCQMRLSSSSGNETTDGCYTNCAINFVEDMRKPTA